MNSFSLQTRLYSGQGSLEVLKRFTNKHIWIICDSFLARSPLIDKLRSALPGDCANAFPATGCCYRLWWRLSA